jgi:6,7-dimethyl-8-ribityllumazine synthase
MKQADQNRQPVKADPSWKIAIIHSSFYKEEMETLVQSAVKSLTAAGIPEANIQIHPAPGSFEVPLIGRSLAEEGGVDALIGLGIIVEGDTHHAGLLAAETARGIMNVQLTYGLPFAFEILYVNTLALARARLNKGEEAAYAVLQSLQEIKRIQEGKH